MKFAKLFDLPILRSRIRSSSVKPTEMLLGYFLAPLCAQASNAIFASYLNRYYGDVIGWDSFGAFSTLLPMLSVILVVAGNLTVGHSWSALAPPRARRDRSFCSPRRCWRWRSCCCS